MEKEVGLIRSELWNKIYNIVSQIPRDDIVGDSMDYPSCATEIEFLFLGEINKQKEYIDLTGCKSNL